MSPWPRRQLRVFMGPDRVMRLPVRGRLAPRGALDEPHRVHVEGAAGAQPWRPALQALEAALPDLAQGRTETTVVLSNQFLRYALVPWQAVLAKPEEELSYARHCLTKVYGKAAQQWDLRLTDDAAGAPRLAAALDPELLDGLRQVLARPGIVLRSIQPHLMAAFNDARRRLQQRSAWLALHEPGHLCLALLDGGAWSRLRSQRIDGAWGDELQKVLEREAFLADGGVIPRDVHVWHLEPDELVLPHIEGWDFHVLNPVPVEPVQAALALAATE